MKRFVLIMLAVSMVIAGLVSYLASPHPDGLERVAEDNGFIEMARDATFNIMPDYSVPGVPPALSNGLAGIIGVLATFGFTYLVTLAFRRRSSRGTGQPTARR